MELNYKIFLRLNFALTLISLAFSLNVKSADFYARANGNWSNSAIWSNTCGGLGGAGIPGIGDNVFVGCDGVNRTVTVDGNFSCNNLSLSSGVGRGTVRITLAGNSLDITGALSINSGGSIGVCLLDAGPGTININGTLPFWNTTTGINRIQVSTGVLNFTPDVLLTSATQEIRFATNNAGEINFLGNFTDEANRLFSRVGANINFHGDVAYNTTNVTLNANSNCNFLGNGQSVNVNSDVTFGFVYIKNGANVLLTNSAGTTTLNRDLTVENGGILSIAKEPILNFSLNLNSGGTLVLNSNLSVFRNWINDGGTFTPNGNTVFFRGNGFAIGGSASTTFHNVSFGIPGGNTRVRYTLNSNIVVNNLVLESNSAATTTTLTQSSGTSLTVNGNATISQLNANSSNSWLVNDGTANVLGDLIFNGNSDITSRLTRVVVTSGSFSVIGTVNWLNNQEVVTEDISVTTGSLSFGSPLNLAIGSGRLRITNMATVNFGGLLNINDIGIGSTPAVFTAAASASLTFENGLTANTNALTFANGSTVRFSGNGTITPNSQITFGNFIINSGANLNLAGDIYIANDYANNGGNLNPGTHTVVLTANNGTQTIFGEDNFYSLSTSGANGTVILGSDIAITDIFNLSKTYNLNGHILTLGNSSSNTLNRTNGRLYGGTFRRFWPSSTPVTSNSGSFYGLFPMGTLAAYRPLQINSTVSPSTGGFVSATVVDLGGTEDINPPVVDNPGLIQRIMNQGFDISTSSLVGGTYDISMNFTDIAAPPGVVLNNYRLATYTGASAGVVGDFDNTTGNIAAPICHRTNLTQAELNNDFRLASSNIGTNPLVAFYYSRKSGDWNDVSANGTWTIDEVLLTPCQCQPASGDVVISSGHTVNLNIARTISSIEIRDNAVLTGNSNLIVNNDFTTLGSGIFNASGGTYIINGNMILNGSGTASKSAGVTNLNGNLTVGNGKTFSHNGASDINLLGNLILNGSINLDDRLLTMSGNGVEISGNGTITATTGSLRFTFAHLKTILAGSNLNISNVFNNNNTAVVENFGSVSISGNLTGNNNAGCVWINKSGSSLTVLGNLFPNNPLLDATESNNTIVYNGSAAQNIKNPLSSTYFDLVLMNSGTKTLPAGIVFENSLTNQSGSILNFNNLAYTIDGNFTNAGVLINLNELTLNGNFTNTGTPNQFSAKFIFSGNSNSSISGTSIFNDLDLNKNASELSINGNTSITGILTLLEGTLNANGNLTIASNATATGRIGIISSGAEILGNVTVERFVNNGFSWYSFGSPFLNATYNDWKQDFNITSAGTIAAPEIQGASFVTGWTSLYSWNEALEGDFSVGYQPVPSILPAVTIPFANGHFAWLQDNNIGAMPKTLSLTGELADHESGVSVPVSITKSTPNEAADGLNFIANPYACPIATNDSGVSWPFTLLGGFPLVYNSSTKNFDVSSNIASGEGFYVHFSNAISASGNATFAQSVKRPNNADSFVKSNRKKNSLLEEFLLVILKEGNHEDEAFLRFDSTSNVLIDNLDLPKIDNFVGRSNIAFMIDTGKFAINALPLESEFSIPILVYKNQNNAETKTFTITFSNIETQLRLGKCLYMVDSVSNVTVPLINDTSYTFVMNDSYSIPRIYLHIANGTDGLVNHVECKNEASGSIAINGIGSGPFQYNWLNMAKDVIRSTSFKFNPDTLNAVSAGLYSVVIRGNEGCPVIRTFFDVIEPIDEVKAKFQLESDSVWINETVIMENLSEFATDFNWNMGDGQNFYQDFEPNHAYQNTGTYTIELQVSIDGKCEKSDSKNIVVIDEFTGIGSNPISKVILSPNPAKSHFLVWFENQKFNKIDLYDLSGKLVYSEAILSENGSNLISVENFAKGIYTLKLLGVDAVYTKKLIIN